MSNNQLLVLKELVILEPHIHTLPKRKPRDLLLGNIMSFQY